MDQQLVKQALMLEQLLLRGSSAFEIIPLGVNCAIAHGLRKANLRFSALPFDWTVTPVQSCLRLIENDFNDFLSPKNLEFLPPTQRLLFDENGVELVMKDDVITPAICREYGILYPHDYPEQHENFIESVYGKYQRRIQRLRQLLAADKHLIFVHHDGSLNDWQIEQYEACGVKFENNQSQWMRSLKDILSSQHPTLRFSVYEYSSLVALLNLVSRKIQAKRQMGAGA